MRVEEPEEEPFIPVEVKVSKKRWWILFVFSGLGFMQVKYYILL